MRERAVAVFFVFFLLRGAVSAGNPEEYLHQLLTESGFSRMSAGIHVVNTASGEVVAGLNSEKLLIPASTLKLVTTGAALEILGPEYRFKTRIGYSGVLKGGTLKGDLAVIGGGDPALGSEYFRDHYFHPFFLDVWAGKVKAAGIRRIEGGLVLDRSLYTSEKIPPTWTWEDMGNYYGAGTSALSVYDNLFRITFSSPPVAGDTTEIKTVYPPVPGLNIENQVLSSNVNSDRAYVFGSPLDGSRVIRGTIPKNRNAFTIKASNPFPERLLGNDFHRELLCQGVLVGGATSSGRVNPQDFQCIYIQESPVLSEIITVLNSESVNLFAEHMVRQIAVETDGKGDLEAGLKSIAAFLQKRDLYAGQIVMEDGSGLSHFNLITPRFMTRFLTYMANDSPRKAAFLNSLPTPGQGTLVHFSPEKFPGDVLRIKSGSMTRVRCYSGYLKTDQGHLLAFSFMFNHYTGKAPALIQVVERALFHLKTEY